MRTSKFTDSQILAILKEYESGQTAKELSRKYGFHYQTLHDGKRNLVG
ncbi:transposase [Chryseobacterium sp. VD8]